MHDTEQLEPEAVTLGDLVTADPGFARALERHGLDYCCGGHRTLADACVAESVDPQVVLAELAAHEGTGPADWASMGPDALVDHLEATHHRYLHAELPRLRALCDKVVAVHAVRHPVLRSVQSRLEALCDELEPHLAKEERVLFPMVRDLVATQVSGAVPRLHRGSLRNPISMMMLEHDMAGGMLADLRDLTGGHVPPSGACASFEALYAGLAELEADTHLHVHKENNVLFPAVVALESSLAS